MLTIITSDTLSQLRYVIDQLTQEEYTLKLPILNQSSIGQHVRHVLEFYICLSQGIGQGVVDYDRRTRNLSIENDPNYANIMLDELINIFCKGNLEDTILTNMIDFNGAVITSNSSVGREMVYLIEHSIHHYAIIAIALRNCFAHINVPEDFGVAHSTSRHNRSMVEAELHHQH
ncbi:MAG: hypothetical protein IPO92_09660 [Saprospiraceae bacterium]|nr:hypothetical protein [Saprospiraceae bacterium]